MNKENRVENPIKRAAITLAHLMADEEREMNDWDREDNRKALVQLNNEIVQKGYDIGTVFHYAEEYKSLSMAEYMEWRFTE